jgi:membrane fusion protein, multidrug efflux system
VKKDLESTKDGRPNVAGYVRALPIQDFEHVHKGQVLAQLVDDDYRAAAAQAETGVATAMARAHALKAQDALQLANVQAAHAVVASRTASFEQNGRDLSSSSLVS